MVVPLMPLSTIWRLNMKLTGIPNTQISTPHGLVLLNRNGVANISDDAASYLQERIEAGALPDYQLEEDVVKGDDKKPAIDPNQTTDEKPKGKGKKKAEPDTENKSEIPPNQQTANQQTGTGSGDPEPDGSDHHDPQDQET